MGNEGNKIQAANPHLNPTNSTDQQQLVRKERHHELELIIIQNSSLKPHL
jgi:hypothetical protein